MDGQTLCRDVRKLLLEGDSSQFVDDRVTLDILWEAAIQINSDLRLLTDEFTTTTIANQADYLLPVNFQELYAVDSLNRLFIKINNGTADNFCFWKDYDKIYYDNAQTAIVSQPIADNFTIRDGTIQTRIESSATSAGVDVNGESILTDSTAPFATVNVGDVVHNLTDGSDGMVIGVTSTSQIITALYDGTNNDWSNNDDYVITTQARLFVTLHPTPSVSGYSLIIPYVKHPDIVYSPYASYPFTESLRFALTKYAAWIYKYRDKEPNYGDAWYKHYDSLLRKNKRMTNRNRNRQGFKVNYNKYSLNDRSLR
jgi:hypothetical protein